MRVFILGLLWTVETSWQFSINRLFFRAFCYYCWFFYSNGEGCFLKAVPALKYFDLFNKYGGGGGAVGHSITADSSTFRRTDTAQNVAADTVLQFWHDTSPSATNDDKSRRVVGQAARESRISMRKSIAVVDISWNNRRRNKSGSASLSLGGV